MRLADQVVAVTGAAGGIGEGIARVLLEEGARVSLWDLSAERTGEVAARVDDSGRRTLSVAVDVTDEDAVQAAVEATVERFGALWRESQEEMLGDAVEVTEGYRTWWSYVPHFISTPGYVYAYAYGQLLALSVYARYEDEGEAFVPRYLELLRAGGSRSPEELGQIVGIDLADPGFWDSGLDLVEAQLSEAEEAANASLARS